MRSSETRLEADADTVLVWIPRSMQSVYDQSIALLATQSVAALNSLAEEVVYTAGEIQQIRLASGRTVEACVLVNTKSQGKHIQLFRADFLDILSSELKKSSILGRFFRLLMFWITLLPRFAKIMSVRPQSEYTGPSWRHKTFLMVAFFLVSTVLVVTAQLVLGLTGISPAWMPDSKWIILAFAVIAGLVPPHIASSALAIGNEYYGIIQYLLYGKKANEIYRYFDDAQQYILQKFPSSVVHLACFSLGSVVSFDYLFPRRKATYPKPRVELASLTFIGFPHLMVDSGIRGYFRGRSWPDQKVKQWHNLFLPDDVLGSEMRPQLKKMFGANYINVIPLSERSVSPQSASSSWLGPIRRHWAYWDSEAKEPSETMIVLARILSPTHPEHKPCQQAD